MTSASEPRLSYIRWVGDAARRSLQASLDERLNQCLQAWGLPPVSASETILLTSPQSLVEPEAGHVQWWASAAQAGTWALWPAEGALNSALRSALFGAGGGKAAHLAEGVAKKAAASLQGEVSALLGGALEPGERPQPEVMAHGHWGLCYRVELSPDLAVHLVFNTDALHAQGWLGSLPPQEPLPAWVPAQALADARMRFDVVVGDTDILLGDLGNLQIGDVLVLAQRIDAPLQLQSLDGNFTRSVYLGQYQGVRAAQFTPRNPS